MILTESWTPDRVVLVASEAAWAQAIQAFRPEPNDRTQAAIFQAVEAAYQGRTTDGTTATIVVTPWLAERIVGTGR